MAEEIKTGAISNPKGRKAKTRQVDIVGERIETEGTQADFRAHGQFAFAVLQDLRTGAISIREANAMSAALRNAIRAAEDDIKFGKGGVLPL